jgi:hypothetical protein
MSACNDFENFSLSDTLPLSSSLIFNEVLLEGSCENAYEILEHEQPTKRMRAAPRSKEQMAVFREEQAKAREQKPQRAAPRSKEQMAVVREQQAKAREEKPQRAPRRTKEQIAVVREEQAKAREEKPQRAPKRTTEQIAAAKEMKDIDTRKRDRAGQLEAMHAAFVVAWTKK